MRYFISDTHFGHRNIIDYENRPFGDTKMMDRVIIDRWNEVVEPLDTVYFLGDFALGSLSYCREIFDQLMGRKVAIIGNHDKTHSHLAKIGFCGVFDEAWLTIEGYRIKMQHIPEPVVSHDYWLMHGHVHSKQPVIYGRRINVSCEVLDYRPISEKQVGCLIKHSMKKEVVKNP